MRLLRVVFYEIKAIILATLYFGICFLIVVALKKLLLEQYNISFNDYLSVLLLSLVTAKVVVIFNRVSFGRQIGLTEVVMRTVTYSFAAFILLLIEHAFSTRLEAGGFTSALLGALRHPDAPRIWATLICVGLAFAAYNAVAVLRREIGAERVSAAYLRPPAARVGEVSSH